MRTDRPAKEGLYRQEFEHGSCGIGFVAHVKGRKSHSIISMGLDILKNMTHRGAEGADSKTGDGAGVMIQVQGIFILFRDMLCPRRDSLDGLVFFRES
jgi:glutamate synthase (NADPH/NADH) large chain